MTKYNARNFSQWEGQKFDLEDGRSYAITTQRERKVVGPSIIKHQGEIIYLPLFIGSPPKSMSYDELVARGKATADRLATSSDEIFGVINDSYDRLRKSVAIASKEALKPESKRRIMAIEYKLKCQDRRGIYEILEKPEPGRLLVIGLNILNTLRGESRNRIIAPEERIERIAPTNLRLAE